MAHGLQLERSDNRRDRWRPSCRCGWSGDWASSQQRAKDQYAAHRHESSPPRRRAASPQEPANRG